MSSEEVDITQPTLYILLGTLGTAVIGGISWLCQKKCRNQECDISSGCCKFHSDSHLRQTIRQEIEIERRNRELESQTDVATD